mmetsp:Transcript_38230/g.74688  ORF Transcript_38230/g.74688 Transcript_38230/m.74688 type:complete len:281 (-) Transcript_38230:807-1649(-)
MTLWPFPPLHNRHDSGTSFSISVKRRPREMARSTEIATPLILLIVRGSTALPVAASTARNTIWPPSSAGSGRAFMIPRLIEMSAAKVSRAPCCPASAPICITPTGPAMLPAADPMFERILPNPVSVCPKMRTNSLLVMTSASMGFCGMTADTFSTYGVSLTPMIPSPPLVLSGVTSSAIFSPVLRMSKWIVLPPLDLMLCTRSLVAPASAVKGTPLTPRTTSPAFIPYRAPAPSGATMAGTCTPGLRIGSMTPPLTTVIRIAPNDRIMLKMTPAERTRAR